MTGIGGTPPSAALDQFLRDSYDIVQSVHRDLPSIRAVASHLTPVEDLVEFQNEVVALHAKLGVLVYASELLAAATPDGVALLTAADVPAQRALLQLKSAALKDQSFFATAAGFNALALQVATLSDSLDGALVDLATKVDQAELTAALAPILDRLDDLEIGVGAGVGQVNDRVTLLITQLQDGTFVSATASALEALTLRVNTSETGIDLLADRTTALEVGFTDLDAGVAAQATAVQQLTTTVNNVGNTLNLASTAITSLTTRTDNLETGQAGASTAIGLLGTRTTANETSISTQGLAINQLTAGITDALNQAALNTSALSGLETRMDSSEAGQLALASDVSQLEARVTDTETGLIGAAAATSALTTRVEATELGLVVASEERTSLRSSLASTGNHLPNSSFAVNTRGWNLFSRGDGWLDAQLARNDAPTAPGALPEGMFALSLIQDEVPTGNAGIRSSSIPVEDLATYILSGYLACENCTVRLEWRLFNGAGTEIGFGLVGEVVNAAPSARLSEWERVHGEIPIASDGAQLQVQVWVTNCNTAFPKAWLLRPQLEPKVGDQEGPSPWMDGVAGIEETFSTAVQSLETRVTLNEGELITLAEAVSNLGSSVGVVREWRITHHSGSAAFDTVGAPLAPGLRSADLLTPAHTFQRGLTLVRFALDGTLASAVRYDTFSNSTERNNLRDALLALTPDDPFILVSQDHHGIKQADLTAALESCGAMAFANVIGSRPYILIGRGEAGKGGGLEYVVAGSVPWQDVYVTVVNDTPKGLNQALSEVVAGQATAIDTLTTRVTDNEDGLSSLASSVTDLNARLDTTETDLTAQSGALDSLTTRVTAAEGEIEAISEDITLLDSRIDNADTGISLNATALTNLTTRVTETEDELVSQSSSITALSSSLTGLAGNVSSNATAITGLDTRVTEVEGEITALSTSSTELTARLGTVESSLINEIITSANKDASFTSSINSLSTRMTDAETGLTGVVGAVESLETRVTVAEGELVATSASVTALQIQVDAIDEGTGGAGAAISALDVRVTQNENDIASQSTAITALQNSVTSANKIFVQPDAPPTAGRTDGDLWIDTDDGNRVYSFSATSGTWVLRADTNKNKVFVQPTAPTATGINDLWFDSDDNFRIYRWSGTQWLEVTDPRTSATASAVSSLITRVTEAEGDIESMGQAVTSLSNAISSPTTGLTAQASALNSLDTRVSSVEGVNSAQATSLSLLNTTVNGNSASISTFAASINGLQSKWNLSLDVNGYISGMTSVNNGTVAEMTIVADNFFIVAPGYAKKQLLSVNANGLNLANDLYLGTGRVVLDTGTYMKVMGLGFGSSNQFVEWYGPKMALNLCTEANAVAYLKVDGSAYFGGSLSAGILSNSIVNSNIGVYPQSTTLGPFGTNGGSKTVVLSYLGFFDTRLDQVLQDPAPTVGDLTITLKVYRKIGSGTEALWQTRTIVAGHTKEWWPNEPGVAPAHWIIGWSANQAFTFTDTSTSTLDFTYRVTAEFSGGAVNGAAFNNNSLRTVRTSITSTEG